MKRISLVVVQSKFSPTGPAIFSIVMLLIPSCGGAEAISHKKISKGVGLGMRKFGIVSFVVAISLFYSFFSQAQLRIAMAGGPHQSKVLEDNNLMGWDSISNNYSPRNGVHLGFMADLPFSEKSNFFFQPGVFFYNKGRNYEAPSKDSTVIVSPDSTVNTGYIESRKQFLNYMDISLNIVYKLKLGKKINFIIGGGPYISFFFDGFEKKEMTLINISQATEENNDLPIGDGAGKYSTLDYGVNGLAGFEFGRVFLTANYSRGLKDFYDPADYTATNYKHEVIGATLGIFVGKPVASTPKDKDGDGTVDKMDKCPEVAGSVKLLGCPDTDSDGITDSEDKCPGQAGPADNEGCPYSDKDGDSVLDKNDKCPDIAGPADREGCPVLDTDGDNLNDEEDKCPTVAGLARYAGCPVPDTDGDGLNDEEDKCPDAKGVIEKNGCPGEEIKKEIVQKIEYQAKQIQFKVNSAELLTASFKVLDDIAAILKSNPEIKVLIEGHTSSEGAYSINMKLSENRANQVKDYLQSKGIDLNRLSAIGFGPDKPLNTGKTAVERAKNRRVELKLSN